MGLRNWITRLGAAALALTGASAAAQERITFVTSWRAQAEQGGYYQAQEKGFYRECGLNLVIRQGGPSIDPVQLLVGGAVEIGLSSVSDATFHMHQAGFPARAVMAAFQRTPQILMAHPDSGIERFEDMRGKPIMIAGSARNAYWPFLRSRYGFTDSQIRNYTGQMAAFLADRNAIQQGLITNEPNLATQALGRPPKVFMIADSGYGTYGSVVVVGQALIDRRPELVQCFVQASVRGWTDYLADPTAGFAAVARENPQNTPEIMRNAFDSLRRANIVETEETRIHGVGTMSDARWQSHYEALAREGIVQPGFDWRRAYTLRFLNRATGS
ncbi:ABC transporter substrate-binding protein [Roseomonas stagni]|uniref:ABC transporter substrate-binding protein n=1 Tax=Falsiroseomonas algicola TaxID=2716930 RepID=A0A6M1LK98_9PROT|nr:ABC transporter substrate-binding protein [Falsiroseomonas algicola]NGM20776.1 ABC transporter substrate-binding protein [Falsiroseomonas algicola]